ncbi:MAG: hypothetical protein GXY36_19225 [Chloroflexi bacterium]|nr:hypothetical protein [Chloroflexota bacterium]
MTFQNLDFGRIIRAVALTFGAAVVLSFMASCFMVPFWPDAMIERFSDALSLLSEPDTQPERMADELNDLTRDYSMQLNLQYFVQWTLAAGLTFIFARTTARQAQSREQALGYGVAIGLGVAMTYGVLCVMCSIADLLLRVLFIGLFVSAGAIAGQVASHNLTGPRRPTPSPSTRPQGSRFDPFGGFTSAPPISQPRGPNAEIYYNMGVQAAIGGRPDEARQHFTHVVQLQPRHVAAWLQLANLAETPEMAWNYIQQARAINPNDPAVQRAVDTIWPKVAASANHQPPPRVQPPYAGGAVDDAEIPRTTLPGTDQTPPPPAPPDELFPPPSPDDDDAPPAADPPPFTG